MTPRTSRTRTAVLLAVALALALAAVGVVLVVRRGADDGAPSGRGRGGAAADPRAGARARPMPLTARPTAATGTTFVKGSWGTGPGEFGRRRDEEANAEGPMSLLPGPGGDLFVLDQVNARIQRFGPDGALEGGFPIGPDTAQDLVLDAQGRLAVLDRLGNAEVLLYDQEGRPLGQIPVVGGGITEGGGVTGIFADERGLYLEREHTEVIRIAGPDGTPDEDRPSDPGRPTRDGTMFLAALLADAKAGRAIVRAFDHDGKVVWQRLVTFPTPILHLLLLDSDRRGHVYLGAYVAREGPPPAYDYTDEATIVVRLGQPDAADRGSLSLPANNEPEELFKELAVTDDGEILQMLVGPDGVKIVRYRFPD